MLQGPLAGFHPAIQLWFGRHFATPTGAQEHGWPRIQRGQDTLIAAPTGSGKTLAAFLAGIDALLRRAETGKLEDATQILYVSPLKALGNDIQRNLEAPLEEIQAIARELGPAMPEIRAAVRTGDTPASARAALLRHPPHILITTPESLYLLLTAQGSREKLRNVRTVIVDEIHALARDKRGSHLALSLARLDHVAAQRPVRIGLSATQKPVEELARFLVGSGRVAEDGTPECAIVDLGHQRDLELAVEVPAGDLEAVASREQWSDIYDRLAELVRQHRTTLIFVNTRRLSERAAFHLAERLGNDQVAAHHGSLAKERRLDLEERLKAGQIKSLVTTASLELGIDIGAIDLVCQIQSPRSITTFLQRVGRSGHALGLRPQGRLFPTTRDELLECAALVRAVRAGRLDRIVQPIAPLDILAQQIVAECSCETWEEEALFALCRSATPYAALDRERFEQVLAMLSQSPILAGGRSPLYLHRDRVAGKVHGRRAARLTALTNGGAIPELGDFRVVAEPEAATVGMVNEDWATESMAGDIFLLGSTSWRILRVEPGTVRVEDARGAPPTIPFWLGEAPARTPELSHEVADLRREVAERLAPPTVVLSGAKNPSLGRHAALTPSTPGHARSSAVLPWLADQCGLTEQGAAQVQAYVGATVDSLGLVPTDTDIVFERFFDESGGMQLVVHAPLGGRINRAWGLALRKRFCATFDFELQAAASDDAFVLSLGAQHSFPLADAFNFLSPATARDVLIQAILPAPMFRTRFRWNATRALAVPRQQAGRKVPPPIQRMRADDLMAAVFPAQLACLENVTWPIEVPDHPIVQQTIHDCLHEAMDVGGFVSVLQAIAEGSIRLHARNTTAPSPMAHEILSAKPYTYLDDAPLEERRTRAVMLRRTLPESARDLGALDQAAIDRVRSEVAPCPRDADELHDLLFGLVALEPPPEAAWQDWFADLVESGRANVALLAEGAVLWFAVENLPLLRLLYPAARMEPLPILPVDAGAPVADRHEARLRLLAGHLDSSGPMVIAALARATGLAPEDVAAGLAQLEAAGVVLRGHFTPGCQEEEFCERRLLSRIHRYTIERLRGEIEPVNAQDLMTFLLHWQHVAPAARLAGRSGVRQVVSQLQGFEAPAVCWERDILPARVTDYSPAWLDELCLSGEVAWARLTPGRYGANGKGCSPSRATPLSLLRRQDLSDLLRCCRGPTPGSDGVNGAAGEILALLQARGALFLDEIVSGTRRLPADVERGLRELVARGLVHSDGFQGLRRLVAAYRVPLHRRRHSSRSPNRRGPAADGAAGRWALLPEPSAEPLGADDLAEQVAGRLLARWGVLCRDLVQRESFTVPWRAILGALRRFEARGVARGGRFVARFSGEQYALPEAVDLLRRLRRERAPLPPARLSAADPLNLVGIVLPGERVPALHTRTVVLGPDQPALA